ncbi:MAG: NUDIX hydrolase [Lachnospiraceae bacterium]|nr:NUDIX hydrolase [Lachnospiraceae bacterium]
MNKIEHIRQDTHNRFLNYFTLDAVTKSGRRKEYYLSSRAESVEELKLVTRENTPDGVTIYALYGEKKDRVVLVRQYRYPIGDYVYEFPSGIIDANESYREAAVREMREETGLVLTLLDADPLFELPRFQTIGMTDESCAIVYGYAAGEPTNAFEEDTEDIEVVLADREEVRRILREELVSANCAHHLVHFIADEEPFGFLEN